MAPGSGLESTWRRQTIPDATMQLVITPCSWCQASDLVPFLDSSFVGANEVSRRILRRDVEEARRPGEKPKRVTWPGQTVSFLLINQKLSADSSVTEKV